MAGQPAALPLALPRLDLRRALRVVVVFVLAGALWYAVRGAYAGALVAGAEPLVARFQDGDGPRLWMEGTEAVAETGIPSGGGKTLKLRNDGVLRVGWTVVFLWTLIGVQSFERLRRLWPWAILSLVLAWGAQSVTFGLEVVEQVAALRAQRWTPILSPSAAERVASASQYLEILNPVLPALLFVPFVLRELTRGGSVAVGVSGADEGGIGRNEPCPCGSGRKFKRCCGVAG